MSQQPRKKINELEPKRKKYLYTYTWPVMSKPPVPAQQPTGNPRQKSTQSKKIKI